MRNRSYSSILGTLFLTIVLSGAGTPESPVADAAMRSDVEMLRNLLYQGADVNAAQGDGMTALHWAAVNGQSDIGEMLLYAGASTEATTRMGAYTPLHLASREGHAGVVLSLLEAGSDPNQRTSSGGVTPLHFAAASGDVETIETLLNYGASIDQREEKSGQTPLIFAASLGRVGAIEVLADSGADLSLQTDVIDLVAREISEKNKEPSEMSEEPAQEEDCSDGQRGKLLSIEQGGPTTYACDDVVSEASGAEEGSTEEEEDPRPLTSAEQIGKVGGMTALLHGARQGYQSAVIALLDAGADVNQVSAEGTSPLLIAVINGHFDLAVELLNRGADINLANEAGGAPLYAVINQQWIPKTEYQQPNAHLQQEIGYLDLLQMFLEHGADPNARLKKRLWYTAYGRGLLGVNMTGATPFWRAAYAVDLEAMEMLMAYGSDPKVATERMPDRRRPAWDGDAKSDQSGLPVVPLGGPGVYPIHAASGVGYGQGFAANSHRHVPGGWMTAMRYLIDELGLDVDARDYQGYTAMHHAASRGDTEMIRYLVEKGADVMVVSREGQTTADMANGPYQRTQPYPEAIALLESLGSINNHNCQSC
ncbi:MAG: ankyrin repeat domain-containing protein [Longimicrobiales bacterium]|nr:ankyrin repeat domain-containing protein [Longimicrobiales bacterium]